MTSIERIKASIENYFDKCNISTKEKVTILKELYDEEIDIILDNYEDEEIIDDFDDESGDDEDGSDGTDN